MTNDHSQIGRRSGHACPDASCVSTYFGEPLSAESEELVSEVRQILTQPIHPNFDTGFNIYRFVMNAERMHRNRRAVVENAAKALDQHLRLRKVLLLDELPDIPFEENVIFRDRFLPHGKVLDATDNHNRLLWYIEYATISVEGIAHGMKSSEATRYQFWQFEHMLRRVNQQEAATGRLSSLRHVVDMRGYEINPFTMLFVSSGTLTYYSQLFHYENYPELVYPIELVNTAKWIHVPYRLIKAMVGSNASVRFHLPVGNLLKPLKMPVGFADRFRLHDGHFIEYLSSEIPLQHIPQSLGGLNPDIKCIPAEKNPSTKGTEPIKEELLKQTESIQIHARKYKYYRVVIDECGSGSVTHTISWYFHTDGDINFGVYFEPPSAAAGGQSQLSNGHNSHENHQHHKHHGRKDVNFEELEYVYPPLKLTAKLYHEHDSVECKQPGTYFAVFCNRHSWLHRRTVHALVQLTTTDIRDGEPQKVTVNNLHTE